MTETDIIRHFRVMGVRVNSINVKMARVAVEAARAGLDDEPIELPAGVKLRPGVEPPSVGDVLDKWGLWDMVQEGPA